mmetsp:Transcript_39243/g.103898  ORF Transcript_39243/g.103898 Transcript_39243/m.103898 type:complete len:109 (+) Transcript_39243:1981-2307(+)
MYLKTMFPITHEKEFKTNGSTVVRVRMLLPESTHVKTLDTPEGGKTVIIKVEPACMQTNYYITTKCGITGDPVDAKVIYRETEVTKTWLSHYDVKAATKNPPEAGFHT